MFDLLGNVLDVICAIGDGLGTFFRFVAQLVTDIGQIAVNGAVAVSHIGSWLSALPHTVVSVITACLAVAIVYKILGREG